MKQVGFLPLGAQFASEALQLRLGRVDLRVQPFRLLSLGDPQSGVVGVVRGIGGRGRASEQPLDRFGANTTSFCSWGDGRRCTIFFASGVVVRTNNFSSCVLWTSIPFN